MRIEHAALYVSNLERAREFFENYFGAVSDDGYQNSHTGFRSYFLSFGEGARLEIMYMPEMKTKEKATSYTGWNHLAFSAGSREMVDELTGRLSKDGYRVLSGPRITGDGYYESCIADMEGNRIEITE